MQFATHVVHDCYTKLSGVATFSIATCHKGCFVIGELLINLKKVNYSLQGYFFVSITVESFFRS